MLYRHELSGLFAVLLGLLSNNAARANEISVANSLRTQMDVLALGQYLPLKTENAATSSRRPALLDVEAGAV